MSAFLETTQDHDHVLAWKISLLTPRPSLFLQNGPSIIERKVLKGWSFILDLHPGIFHTLKPPFQTSSQTFMISEHLCAHQRNGQQDGEQGDVMQH